jgi:hypothetical protein
MLQRFRQRFGTAGLVVAILALVAALGGTALAASGALTGKQKKEVKKIAKKFAGKPGAPGAAGPAGPQGPAGPAGAAGKDGAAGPEGPEGPEGAKGATGPTGVGSKGATGPEGPAGATGATGATGPEGGGGGFPTVLPEGESEIGTWSVTIPPMSAFYEAYTSISFPIPVSEAGGAEQVFFFTSEEVLFEEFGTSGCKWALFEENALPESTVPGTLCVFTETANAYYENMSGEPTFVIPGTVIENGYGPTGTNITVSKKNTEPAVTDLHMAGAWAIQAPEA